VGDASIVIYLPPNKSAQAEALLTCIREVFSTDLGRDTDYPYILCSFFSVPTLN
jgi:hypothetical protein